MFEALAVWTGLEPATSAVTGRHSNQLNYQTFYFNFESFSFEAITNVLLYFISTKNFDPIFKIN